MEKAELFNDIFTSAKAYFLYSAHTCLIVDTGLQETKNQLKNVELKYRMPDQIELDTSRC